MGLNQWRNTDTIIDWFKGVRNKHLCKFAAFDIKELARVAMQLLNNT